MPNLRPLRSLRAVKPLDLLRRRLTSGLQVDAGEEPVSRGGAVEALVTIVEAQKVGNVEVGIVCTELYDEDVTEESLDDDGVMREETHRETHEAKAHEEWQPIDCTVGAQNVRFTIPREAPFSYDGECLSFKWEIVARGHRHHRLDALAAKAISVRP